MMKTAYKPAFWITNASPFNVTLADLALNIGAFRTMNLLDKRHHNYTLEQLIKSKESGSIFKKRDKIKVRELAPPEEVKKTLPIQREAVMPSRERSVLVIEEKEYDELKMAEKTDAKEAQKKMDEDFARDSAELNDEIMPNSTDGKK